MSVVAVSKSIAVAPLAGAWIEISLESMLNTALESLPSRERGLKCNMFPADVTVSYVAPLAGAWIEMSIWNA